MDEDGMFILIVVLLIVVAGGAGLVIGKETATEDTEVRIKQDCILNGRTVILSTPFDCVRRKQSKVRPLKRRQR